MSNTADGRVFETGLTLEEIRTALTFEEAAQLAGKTAETIRSYANRGMPIVGTAGKWSHSRVRRQVLEAVLTGQIVLRPMEPKQPRAKASA